MMEISTLKSSNFQNVCHLCLTTNKTDRTSLKTFKSSDTFTKISLALQEFQIHIDSQFPRNICLACIEKLTDFLTFKRICITSLETINSLSYQIELDLKSEYSEVDKGSIKQEAIKKERDVDSSSESVQIQCDQCGGLYKRKSFNLHSHTHLTVKPFGCDVCGKRFTRRAQVIIHMRIHTNEQPYVCEICSRGFHKSGGLFRHLRIHSDQMNYNCTFCDRKFKHESSLKSHKLSHTGERPYECDCCQQTYASYSGLRKHLTKYHPKKEPNVLD